MPRLPSRVVRPLAWLLPCACLLAIGLFATADGMDARTWYVAAGGTGNGSAQAPFGRIAAAIAAAQAGDVVSIASGTYAEALTSVRGGASTAPIVIRGSNPANRPVLTTDGRVATLSHPHLVVEQIVLDGQFGASNTVRIGTAAAGLVLRGLEIRRSSRDCVDMGSPSDVLIEDSVIHSCLNPARGRTDAHGVVAGSARRLTIRRTEIHTFSGDAIQLDPSRSPPGWTDVRVDGCRLWLAPLTEATNGFAAGIVPGENAIDTKTPADSARAVLTVVNTEAHGFRDGLIANMAAFNVKERVDAVFDRITVSDSDIGFRVRGTDDAGASVTIRNTVMHGVATAVRYEDDIRHLRLHHVTLGRDVPRAFQRASSPQTVADVRNLLVLGTVLPSEAGDRGLAVGDSAFVDAAAHDYRLAPNSPAIDRAAVVAGVSVDRLGVARPQGLLPDVGAHEYCPPPCRPAAPANLRAQVGR